MAHSVAAGGRCSDSLRIRPGTASSISASRLLSVSALSISVTCASSGPDVPLDERATGGEVGQAGSGVAGV